MEKCHAPFKIQRVDYICDWLEHVLSEYLVGTEAEWEKRIYDNWYVDCCCISANRSSRSLLQSQTVNGPRLISTQVWSGNRFNVT